MQVRQFDPSASLKAGNAPTPHSSVTPPVQVGGGRLARAGSALLQLQRAYGNRYVQQVVERGRQRAGTTAVSRPTLVLGVADDRHETGGRSGSGPGGQWGRASREWCRK